MQPKLVFQNSGNYRFIQVIHQGTKMDDTFFFFPLVSGLLYIKEQFHCQPSGNQCIPSFILWLSLRNSFL